MEKELKEITLSIMMVLDCSESETKEEKFDQIADYYKISREALNPLIEHLRKKKVDNAIH